MDREQLIKWIKDPNTSINRRRLYLTMLGVCGQAEDIQMLEEFIKSGDRKKQAGLDALIACYLMLNGDQGVGLIEDTFLKDKSVEYVDTLAAVSALRFHGTESKKISKQRIVGAIRLLLDRPKMADMIIPDLARWEDWSVMERLVQMFKDADEETNWLRVPVITYLRACPDPKAKKYIAELKEIDPDAVRRADFFLDFEDGADDGDSKKDGKEDTGAGSADGTEDLTDSIENEQPVSTLASDRQVATVGNADVPASNPHMVRRVPIIATGPADEETTVARPNPSPPALVSSNTNDTMAKAPVPDAVASASAPVATVQTNAMATTWQIVFIPMLMSIAIFVLLWSVINGWFERLIF